MQLTDLAITIPGTNNLELAFFATPMLVLLPLNQAEKIPLEGLIGLIGEIPGFGPWLKRRIIPKMVEKKKYFSLVNINAEEKIVPEMVGVFSPVDVLITVEDLIKNKGKLKEMKSDLKEVAGGKGAAANLVQVVDQVLLSSP